MARRQPAPDPRRRGDRRCHGHCLWQPNSPRRFGGANLPNTASTSPATASPSVSPGTIALDQLNSVGVAVEGTAPKIMILSQDGTLLYSDLTMPQSLIGLTNPALGGAVGLLVHRVGQYELATWNAAVQRFE